MSVKDSTNLVNSQQIHPFPVENPKPQLSINTDDTDIRRFYIEYFPMVYRRCLAILRNREDAQDMAQNVFKNIHRLKSKGKLDILRQEPKSYLNKAAKNMSLNEIKRARKELNRIYDLATNGSLIWFKNNREHDQGVLEAGVIENGYERAEAKTIVKAILDEQDETTRKIYFYRYYDDMTLEQTGEVVGLKKSAVQKRVKDLEKQARVFLGKEKK